jgi:NAD(P)-dependent dehydrogenase (short-subunit alcohol dehydrogenase family)
MPLAAGVPASQQLRAALVQQHPLGRLGRAEDQAAAICWLLGEESAWVTGQALGVDGGFGAIRR